MFTSVILRGIVFGVVGFLVPFLVQRVPALHLDSNSVVALVTGVLAAAISLSIGILQLTRPPDCVAYMSALGQVASEKTGS